MSEEEVEEDFEFEKIGGLIGPQHFLLLFPVFLLVARSYNDPSHLPGYSGEDRWVRCWNFPDFILGEYCHNPQTDTAYLFASLFESVVLVLALAVIQRILRGPSDSEPEPEPTGPPYACDPDEGDVGVCEFHYSPLDAPPDENDGLCPYCGGFELPDMLLLFKAIDDRWNAVRSVQNALDDALHDRLDRAVSATVDHDIDLANSEEGTPDSRVEALKLKVVDHREQILEAMASHLDEASYEKLGREMKAHVDRVRAWEPKENWWEDQSE